mmetsp:Transcript_31969/g.53943  ORF Transcript_31969/g.53943 Transcript_31969/m.53943 type:complete len:448 (+) Transcript_31969:48-1391(+)
MVNNVGTKGIPCWLGLLMMLLLSAAGSRHIVSQNLVRADSSESCESRRFEASLKLANDSWWFRFKELKSRGQQGGILSHAKVEPNVESTLDNLLASILSASGDSVTIVDVGANIGQTLVRLHAAWVGKGKVPRIISVEPGKTAFAKLQQAAKKFQAHLNLELVNAAVSNATGKFSFSDSKQGANQNAHLGLDDPRESFVSQNRVELVKVYTLETLMAEKLISKVDFLKIDTEGFEKLVLQGAASVFARGGVSVIQFEYGLNWFTSYARQATGNATLHEVSSALDALGYDVFFGTPSDLLRVTRPWHEYYELPRGIAVNTNVVAVLRSWPLYSKFLLDWNPTHALIPVCALAARPVAAVSCEPVDDDGGGGGMGWQAKATAPTELRFPCVNTCSVHCKGVPEGTPRGLVPHCRCTTVTDLNSPRRDWRLDFGLGPLPSAPAWSLLGGQ